MFMVDLNSKKAQMEILGIAVVVIIILVGTMFFYILMNPLSDRSVVLDVAKTEIGANTLNTLLRTTTTCKRLTVAELAADCVDSSAVMCNAENSCNFLKSQINNLLSQTLENWGIDYQFDILKQQGSEFISAEIKIQTKTCGAKEHFEQIIPTQLTLAKISLDLC